jgi:hypothetical protein
MLARDKVRYGSLEFAALYTSELGSFDNDTHKFESHHDRFLVRRVLDTELAFFPMVFVTGRHSAARSGHIGQPSRGLAGASRGVGRAQAARALSRMARERAA